MEDTRMGGNRGVQVGMLDVRDVLRGSRWGMLGGLCRPPLYPVGRELRGDPGSRGGHGCGGLLGQRGHLDGPEDGENLWPGIWNELAIQLEEEHNGRQGGSKDPLAPVS